MKSFFLKKSFVFLICDLREKIRLGMKVHIAGLFKYPQILALLTLMVEHLHFVERLQSVTSSCVLGYASDCWNSPLTSQVLCVDFFLFFPPATSLSFAPSLPLSPDTGCHQAYEEDEAQ